MGLWWRGGCSLEGPEVVGQSRQSRRPETPFELGLSVRPRTMGSLELAVSLGAQHDLPAAPVFPGLDAQQARLLERA